MQIVLDFPPVSRYDSICWTIVENGMCSLIGPYSSPECAGEEM